MAKHKIKHYGWKPDPLDHRDIKYSISAPVELESVYLTDKYKLPTVYNQLSIGSCTGQGIGGVVHFILLNYFTNINMSPSRLFIYYNERVTEGTVNIDAGASIRDGIKSIAKEGVCSEITWPYVIQQFATKPPKKAYDEALNCLAIEYKRVNGTNKAEIVDALKNGHPVVFGFSVFPSFESTEVARTGILNLPTVNESPIGGHCVVIVGYNKETDRFVIRNSWGTGWGQKGYFTMPASYVTNPYLASDFWVVTKLQFKQ